VQRARAGEQGHWPDMLKCLFASGKRAQHRVFAGAVAG